MFAVTFSSDNETAGDERFVLMTKEAEERDAILDASHGRRTGRPLGYVSHHCVLRRLPGALRGRTFVLDLVYLLYGCVRTAGG